MQAATKESCCQLLHSLGSPPLIIDWCKPSYYLPFLFYSYTHTHIYNPTHPNTCFLVLGTSLSFLDFLGFHSGLTPPPPIDRYISSLIASWLFCSSWFSWFLGFLATGAVSLSFLILVCAERLQFSWVLVAAGCHGWEDPTTGLLPVLAIRCSFFSPSSEPLEVSCLWEGEVRMLQLL